MTDPSDETPEQHADDGLDPGAFDEAEFDQPAFELVGRQRRVGVAGSEVLNHAREAALGQSERHLRTSAVLFSHGLYFQSAAGRSSSVVEMRRLLRAIINS